MKETGAIRKEFTDSIGCPPKEMTYDQAADVVRKYLKDHPEELHLRAVILINKAMRHAWPCKQ
jgi:hypothetical protein